MNVDVDYVYGESIIANIYNDDGTKFMKTELKTNIPLRPYYRPENEYSCTEIKYLKWKNKVADKIEETLVKSLPEHL